MSPKKNSANEVKRLLNTKAPIAEKRDEILSILYKLSQDCEYPIKSFPDFIKKMGKKEIFIMDKNIVLQECDFLKYVIHTIPAYYFPISNQEDFINKAQELIW